MERLILLSDGNDPVISLKDLPEDISPHSAGECGNGDIPGGALPERLDAFERQCLLDALEATSHNRNHTAEILGISRFSLLRRLQKHGIA